MDVPEFGPGTNPLLSQVNAVPTEQLEQVYPKLTPPADVAASDPNYFEGTENQLDKSINTLFDDTEPSNDEPMSQEQRDQFIATGDTGTTEFGLTIDEQFAEFLDDPLNVDLQELEQEFDFDDEPLEANAQETFNAPEGSVPQPDLLVNPQQQLQFPSSGDKPFQANVQETFTAPTDQAPQPDLSVDPQQQVQFLPSTVANSSVCSGLNNAPLGFSTWVPTATTAMSSICKDPSMVPLHPPTYIAGGMPARLLDPGLNAVYPAFQGNIQASDDPATFNALPDGLQTLAEPLRNLNVPSSSLPAGMENVAWSEKRRKWVLYLGPKEPEDFRYSPGRGEFYMLLGDAVKHPVEHLPQRPGKAKMKSNATQYAESFQHLPKVIYDRRYKKGHHPHLNPENIYTSELDVPQPWGDDGFGNYMFWYDKGGILANKMTAQRIQHYIDAWFDADPQHEQFTMWVQHHPSQCVSRTKPYRCLWEACPMKDGKFHPGDFRVAFDEYWQKTTNGTRDPFKVVGAMHLNCFEQCLDPVPYYLRGILQPDFRDLPREQRNPMSLTITPCPAMIEGAFRPWMKRHIEELFTTSMVRTRPREHKKSLCRRFHRYARKVEAQARKDRRDESNRNKPEDQKATVDVVEGDLKLLSQRSMVKGRMFYEDIDLNPCNNFQPDQLLNRPQELMQLIADHIAREELLYGPPGLPEKKKRGRKRRCPIEDDEDDSDENPPKRHRSNEAPQYAAPIERRTAQGGILAFPKPI